MKKTRRSLITSIVVLILCSAMFVGSTFAWFTDTVSNTGNKIQAGTLKIDLLQKGSTLSSKQKTELEKRAGYTYRDNQFYSLRKTSDTDLIDEIPVFDYDKWEPGYTEFKALKVDNIGNLALKFKLSIVPNGDVVKTTDGKSLADVIDVYTQLKVGTSSPISEPTSFDDVKNNVGFYWTKTTLSELINDEDGAAYGYLYPHSITATGAPSTAICYIVLHMQEEAGNEYQNLSIGGTFDIRLDATQYTFEKDGFDSDQYDKDATYQSGDSACESTDPLVYFSYIADDGYGTPCGQMGLFENGPEGYSKMGEKFQFVVPPSVLAHTWYHRTGNETDGYTYIECANPKHHNLDVCDSETHTHSKYLLRFKGSDTSWNSHFDKYEWDDSTGNYQYVGEISLDGFAYMLSRTPAIGEWLHTDSLGSSIELEICYSNGHGFEVAE